MFNTTGLMSSLKQDWRTPAALYKELDKEFNFNFDPCPSDPNFDGLNIDWKDRNFVNPPYKNIKDWIKKGYEEYKKGKLVVFLIPARTDTSYFHIYIYPYAELRFIRGRLKFNDQKGSAPFPSMIAILRG